jgi:hypothetical protein
MRLRKLAAGTATQSNVRKQVGCRARAGGRLSMLTGLLPACRLR